MLALIASTMLGLYVFLPDFLFSRLAIPYVRLKKEGRSKVEEILAGVAVAIVPFVIALILSKFSWFVGHWPWPIYQTDLVKYADYRTVLSGLYSDKYFDTNYAQFWDSLGRIRVHQMRLLVWIYALLGIEILIVSASAKFYGSLYRLRIFRATIGVFLLGRASQWQALLGTYLFPRKQKPRVMLDVLTTNDQLYDGEVADFFLDDKGDLTGLLLKRFRRFRRAHFESDRANNRAVRAEDYWGEIPGANFFIPYDKVANINIRYVFTSTSLEESVRSILAELNVKASNVGIVSVANQDSGQEPRENSPGDKTPDDPTPGKN